MDRRSLLKYAATLPAVSAAPRLSQAQMQPQSANEQPAEKADYTLRIANGLVELAPDHIASTTLYNGQFPGPLIRLTEGKRVVVDVHNDTDTPELVHWHGQMIPSDVDGAAEEGTPYVPPHGMRRISFLPKPSGFRFYHTHVVAGGDLNRGTYTGQAGPVYIEPASNPGAYDREVFLVLKEFLPSFSQGGDMDMDFLAGEPIKRLQDIGKQADDEFKGPKGYEVGYDLFGINGKCSAMANRSASSKATACCSMCSMRAPAKSAALLCPVTSSRLSRSTAIRCRFKPRCRCCGSAPRNASPPSPR